jgi:hypothetical protein
LPRADGPYKGSQKDKGSQQTHTYQQVKDIHTVFILCLRARF